MPPKAESKKAERGQVKSQEKAKQRVAEDKTFGLKNKNKSKVVQKFIKGVQSQATGGPQKGGEEAKRTEEFKKKEEKKKKLAELALLNSLWGQAKTATDRQNDSKAMRQAAKISPWVDRREISGVDLSKHSTAELETFFEEAAIASLSNIPDGGFSATCKHFIDAVENDHYGWFWECPSGGDACKYRHALAPGYELKKDKGELLEVFDEIPLEERIEEQRSQLTGGIPVTLESFAAWLQKRDEAAAAAIKKDAAMSGKALFTENPDLFEDDEGAEEILVLSEGEDDAEEEDEDRQESEDNSANSEDESSNDEDEEESPEDEEEGEAVASKKSDRMHVKNQDLFLNDEEVNLDEL